ncbi:MAG: hypothetical protein D6722_24985, partial [Bacteroidetes bacterium]
MELLFRQWAPPHATTLAVSESVDPALYEGFFPSGGAAVERSPALYGMSKAASRKTDFVFVAASDLPSATAQLLFYLSNLNPGGVALIETSPESPRHSYASLGSGAGLRLLYEGAIKDIEGLVLPASLRSHANTRILLFEKLLPRGQRLSETRLSVILPRSVAQAERWADFVRARSMEHT